MYTLLDSSWLKMPCHNNKLCRGAAGSSTQHTVSWASSHGSLSSTTPYSLLHVVLHG
jgi:hypothetical protein